MQNVHADVLQLRDKLDLTAPFAIHTTSAGGLQCHFTFSGANEESNVQQSATVSDFDDDSAQSGTLVSSSGSTSTSSSGFDSQEFSSILLSDDDTVSASPRAKRVFLLSTSGTAQPSITCSSSSSMVSMRTKRTAEPVASRFLSQVDLNVLRHLFGLRSTHTVGDIPWLTFDYSRETLRLLPVHRGVFVPTTQALVGLGRQSNHVTGIVVEPPEPEAPDKSTLTMLTHLAPRAMIEEVPSQDGDQDAQLPGAWLIEGSPALHTLAFWHLTLCLMFLLLPFALCGLFPSLWFFTLPLVSQ